MHTYHHTGNDRGPYMYQLELSGFLGGLLAAAGDALRQRSVDQPGKSDLQQDSGGCKYLNKVYLAQTILLTAPIFICLYVYVEIERESQSSYWYLDH